MLTSKSNPLIKKIKSLGERKYRLLYNLCFIEGEKFVRDISAFGITAEYIIATEKYMPDGILAKEAICVDDNVYAFLSDEKTPQGIMGVYNIPEHSLNDVLSEEKLLCLDRVSQPDNAGALIRTAVCAGYGGVIILEGSCDAFSPRSARSSAGCVAKLKTVRIKKEELFLLKQQGFKLLGADMNGTEDASVMKGKTVLVIGNEGAGLESEVRALCDGFVRIPLYGDCESLNAAVAGSILMYKSVGY